MGQRSIKERYLGDVESWNWCWLWS